MCSSPLFQSVSKIMHRWSGEKQLLVQYVKSMNPGTVRSVIEHVLFNSCCTYLSVITHAQERDSFCYSSKSRAHLSNYRYEGDVTS